VRDEFLGWWIWKKKSENKNFRLKARTFKLIFLGNMVAVDWTRAEPKIFRVRGFKNITNQSSFSGRSC